MSDPTKLHRLFGDQNHVNVETRMPVRAVVKDYDGNTARVYIPSFDGGKAALPVDYVGANFQPGDLLLVCKDEADTYWVVGMQSVPETQAKFVSGSNSGAGGGSTPGGGDGALPKNADKYLSKKQQMFSQRFNADLGMEPCVICGWVLAEQPKTVTCAPNGCNNWLDIGAFDAGSWAGGGSDVWSTPVKGADASVSFITGKQVNGINAPSQAGANIPSLVHAPGKSIDEQIHMLQTCGWASSGYPSLPTIVGYFR